MHIVFFIPSLEAGGAEKVLVSLANSLSATNKVSIITLSRSEKTSFYPLENKIQLLNLGLDAKKSLGIKNLYRIWLAYKALTKVIKTIKPDLLISFLHKMNMQVVLANSIKVPLIISERVDPYIHPLPECYKKLRLKLYKKADKLVVQTNTAKQYFQDYVETTLIANSIKEKKQAFRKQDYTLNVRQIKLITVGRLAEQKDHRTLIFAMEDLIKEYPNLQLSIFGEGPLREELFHLIQKKKLEDNIQLPGIVDNIEIELSQSDIFVFPSKYEGFPNALGEAMALGLPVVVSNCSGNNDLIENNKNGLLFPVKDHKALANKIISLLENQTLREKFGQEALRTTLTYSEKTIFNQWEQLIHEVGKES